MLKNGFGILELLISLAILLLCTAAVNFIILFAIKSSSRSFKKLDHYIQDNNWEIQELIEKCDYENPNFAKCSKTGDPDNSLKYQIKSQ
ncbi:MAG: prepilin-type N-terminal cleavage/methylation domain-containing protein [Bdellovibrionales bacterium]|nr:prepilin-type N-terminal cleavage/methylation domain-containing protein [Bdellovibrionales bacterium]